MVTYPKDWNSLTLGDLGNIKMCRRIFSYQTEKIGQIPFYKIGTFGKKADAYISRELNERYKSLYPYPQKGDILISAAGTIGRTVAFDGKDAYFQDSNIVWLDTSDKEVDNEFLKYFYESYPWTNLEGTTIRRLYNSLILSTFISLPSLPEQRAIAETLSCFDDHIVDLTELIEKKKAIRDGVLEDLLSGRTRLDGFTKPWKKTTLGDEYNVIMGQSPNSASYNLSKAGVPMVQGNADIKNRVTAPQRYTTMPTKVCDIGDTILTVRAPVGTVSKANQVVCLGRGVCAISGKNKDFIFHMMRHYENAWESIGQGSTFTAVSGKEVRNFEIWIPENDEQIAIASILNSMDEEILSLEEEKDKMLQIKAGAMDDLLTGRIRLIRQGG
jgi:type I restriction enzyme S subunit